MAVDRLVVSSVNGGGVFLLADGAVQRVSDIDSSGITETDEGMLWARQSESSNEIRRIAGSSAERTIVAPQVLDLHDVLWDGEVVYAACTEINAVLALDAGSLTETGRWQLAGEPDAAHVNSLCLHDSRLLATRFGPFETHRGYKGRTRGAGQIYDVRSGDVLVSGLSQPHSLRSHGGLLWVCDSEARMLRAYDGTREVHAIALEGYARGLAFGAEGIHVGLSRGRNDPDSALGTARVLTLDPRTFAHIGTTLLPVDEVYDICVLTRTSFDAGGVALDEARREAVYLRASRDDARASAETGHALARTHADARHAGNLAILALEAQVAEDGQKLSGLEAEVARLRAETEQHTADARLGARHGEEARHWTALLADDAEAARAQVTRQAERIAQLQDRIELLEQADLRHREQADALVAAVEARDAANTSLRKAADSLLSFAQARTVALATLRAHIDAVHRSRSWRWTRPLRSHDPVTPDVPEAQIPLDVTDVLASPAPAAPARQDVQVPASPDTTPLPELADPPSRAQVPVAGLAFPVTESPRVSIVVTAYGCFEETRACLESIREAGDAVSFEVILIEDASGESEMDRFGTVPGLRYHRNAVNLGFLGSAASGADSARGAFIHFLNNDTQVRPGWLDALVHTFDLFHDCGIAGSQLESPGGRLQEDGGIVWSDADACNYGRGAGVDDQAHAVLHEADYVSGAAILVRASLWRELGGFDTRYAPAYYEDTDLAFRMREMGYRTYVQPRSRVIHREGLSHGTDVASGGKQGQVRNRDVFHARWADTLVREQCAPGEHVFLARDRGQLRRLVLVIDRFAPRTDQDAGSRAIWHLMQALRRAGYAVKFWSMAGADDEPLYVHNLANHGIEVLSGRDGFEDWYAAHHAYVDVALLSRPLVAEPVLPVLRSRGAARVVYYGHDIHFQRIDREFALRATHGLDAHARHVQAVEEAVWARSDVVLYPSREEAEHVASWAASTGRKDLLAMEFPLFAFGPAPAGLGTEAVATLDARDEVLFVGGFAHAPNSDAVTWFVQDVWPRIRLAAPELRLVLVGSDPDDAIAGLAADDIEVTGGIAEHALLDRYRRARVAIAPLRFGAGVKGKILEAMHLGVPCVTTPSGAQGLGAADALHVAADAAGLADAVVALARDDASWSRASIAGCEYIARHLSVDAVAAALAAVLPPPAYPDMAARRARIAGIASDESSGTAVHAR